MNTSVESKSINSRIKEIKNLYFGDKYGSHKSFCEQMGISSTNGTNWMAKNYNVGREVIEKILVAFPNVDAKWLLTGIGEMLVNSNTERTEAPKSQPQDIAVLELISEMRRKNAELDKKDAEIDELKAQLKELQRKYDEVAPKKAGAEDARVAAAS